MRYIVGLIVLLVLIGAGVAGGVGYWGYVQFNAPGPLAESATLVIERGSSVTAISRQLRAAGVIEDERIFSLGVRVFGENKPLQAGEYSFPAEISPREAMLLMNDGFTVKRKVTVAEGLTSREILAVIAAAEGLEGEVPATAPAEGTLLPETYFYAKGDSRADIIGRMSDAMTETLTELWAARDPNLPIKSPAEAVTLASIVEKETGVASERPRVAAVFVNRLRQGIPLQSDPTVIFALTNGQGPLDRALTFADLETQSPYNTYVVAGLPPGPIANPGRAALEAVLHPLATEEIYFVADGSGGHVFAKTLAEHNKNVANWRKIQKQQTQSQ